MSEPAQVNNLTLWFPLIGAFGGALITGLIAFGINWTNKRSEERKHQQSLMFNAAIENWKKVADITLDQVNKGAVKSGGIPPLDSYIIHIMKLSELLTDKKVTKENVAKIINESIEVSQEAIKCQEKLDIKHSQKKK